jgi:hypothetical protein
VATPYHNVSVIHNFPSLFRSQGLQEPVCPLVEAARIDNYNGTCRSFSQVSIAKAGRFMKWCLDGMIWEHSEALESLLSMWYGEEVQ